MSSAAVVIMASEPPGGGQQRKLHPLFAPSKPNRSDGEETSSTGGQSIPQQQSVPQQPAPQQPAPQQPALQQATLQQTFQQQTLAPQPYPANPPPTIPQPSSLPGVDTAPSQPQTQPVTAPPAPVPPVAPASALDVGIIPAEPAAPVQMNAFEKLKQPKRKADTNPAVDESTTEGNPSASEPKRRGRPPKKRKSSPPPPPPPAQSNVGLTPTQSTESPSPLVLSHSNGETLVEGITNSSALPSAVSSTAASTPALETPPTEQPKRLLQFNPKTGTIGSPPKPKETPLTKSGRPKRKSGAASNTPPPLAVAYPSQDAESRVRIGTTVDSILSGNHRVFPLPTPAPDSAKGSKKAQKLAKPAPAPAPVTKQQSTVTPATPKPATTTPAPSKSTHPFFTGGLAKSSAAKDGTSNTPATGKSSAGGNSAAYYTSTPCSPKRRGGPQQAPGFKMPQFGAKNGMLRVPGACHPAWPWKGTSHVHPEGDANLSTAHFASTKSPTSPLPHKKRKGNAIDIRKEELILEQKLQGLGISSVIEDIRNANSDEFAPPPPELRLPTKHIESGVNLRARIAPQLRTTHPGLQSLYNSIATTLSAFDQHDCESLSWAQKYAPSCAMEVLQSGKEPVILKDWLEALKVVAVDTGSAESGESKAAAAAAAAKGGRATKRRRKKNKLDGFIVSSDDEDGDGETSDNEADWTASGRYGLVKDTVVRAGNLLDKAGRAGARLTNTVVISGPNGCGKSAAVYAVAKELGFEVFEINASSRRSGKDVIDRIGDMTRNHLVQHKNKKQPKATVLPSIENKKQPKATALPSIEAHIDSVDDYDPDLEDAYGDPDPDYPMADVEIVPAPPTKKQPTMSSFFKLTSTSADKPTTTATTSTEGKSSQKQSLILLEEADLLYEEDKQFWATVMNLIVQSKRPFVITCNDETLIPLHNLRLHAILRFTPPPSDVAIDRLLMIAACEGHALQRKAVESLYEVRNHDFRASLADLQFWCQISVGDRRGGFDWFYQRWPEGIDRDEGGHIKRVISENTYQEGMGWLNNDSGASKAVVGSNVHAAHCANVEDSLVQQAWNDWQLDMGQWQDSLELSSWSTQLSSSDKDNRSQRLLLLESYSNFAEAMSDADLVSSMVFATGNKLPLDATQPELPYKAHEDYILGQQLLERTTPAHELDDLRLPMATAMRCTAKQILRGNVRTTTYDSLSHAHNQLDHLDEPAVMSAIRKDHAQPDGLVPSQTPSVRRIDFSLAFDPIAVPSSAPSNGMYSAFYAPTASASASSSSSPSSHLDPSVFDRNMEPIAVDVAPFVRGIIAHEGRLQKERNKHTSFLSEAMGVSTPAASSTATGGANTSDSDAMPVPAARRRPAKRMRTTRTAMSALEGGSRSAAALRRDRWFDGADINPVLVMRTGGDGWDGVVEGLLAGLNEAAAAADARDAAIAAQEEAAAAAAAAEAAAAAPPPPPPPPPTSASGQQLRPLAPAPPPAPGMAFNVFPASVSTAAQAQAAPAFNAPPQSSTIAALYSDVQNMISSAPFPTATIGQDQYQGQGQGQGQGQPWAPVPGAGGVPQQEQGEGAQQQQ
ncbi:hypothetical protein Sste5346_008253 [Sporothrix stenoceras]|uniref:AAA+ ATPase domain-containing protein n=1 Tax=Sporothrix stenoceras TaxID=5173 RepID=A0ABR3YR99_9PEZI